MGRGEPGIAGGFPVSGHSLSAANDRRASGERRNPLFFVLKETHYYFCPLQKLLKCRAKYHN